MQYERPKEAKTGEEGHSLAAFDGAVSNCDRQHKLARPDSKLRGGGREGGGGGGRKEE